MSDIAKPDYTKVNRFFDDFVWFITRLFEDEDNDGFLEAENRYTPKQIEWAISKFVSFYVDKNVIGEYAISKLVSCKKLLDVDLTVIYPTDVITYNVRHKF